MNTSKLAPPNKSHDVSKLESHRYSFQENNKHLSNKIEAEDKVNDYEEIVETRTNLVISNLEQF